MGEEGLWGFFHEAELCILDAQDESDLILLGITTLS